MCDDLGLPQSATTETLKKGKKKAEGITYRKRKQRFTLLIFKGTENKSQTIYQSLNQSTHI